MAKRLPSWAAAGLPLVDLADLRTTHLRSFLCRLSRAFCISPCGSWARSRSSAGSPQLGQPRSPHGLQKTSGEAQATAHLSRLCRADSCSSSSLQVSPFSQLRGLQLHHAVGLPGGLPDFVGINLIANFLHIEALSLQKHPDPELKRATCFEMRKSAPSDSAGTAHLRLPAQFWACRMSSCQSCNLHRAAVTLACTIPIADAPVIFASAIKPLFKLCRAMRDRAEHPACSSTHPEQNASSSSSCTA